MTDDNGKTYYTGTLEMGEVTLTFPGGETLTTRAYRQAGGNYCIPGPTLMMVPGNKYVLRFRNTLPYQPLSGEHNTFKDPNVTNLHTHGLHLSGESPGDDVTRFFAGGFGGDFVYDIPDDHMGGTYWYHAHHHGSTFLQVSSGAFGLILIDDTGDGIPPTVEAMAERHLILAYLDPSVAGAGGDTLISGTLQAGWTANGTRGGNLTIPLNTWEHWRVLLADQDARIKTVTIGAGCNVALMARDGVWRTQVPKVLTTNSLDLTGASRADLAVRCSNNSSITVGNQLVANVLVQGAANSYPSPYNASGGPWFSNRPSYLRDLRGVGTVHTESVNMGARTINGSKFDALVPTFTLPALGVEEWTLKGATNHPFHLHVYHMQITKAGGCGAFEEGEYYDTVAANCTLRFDLNPTTAVVYDGRTIMHCHILEHEDQGAMGWADVLGGLPPPTFPVDSDISSPYSEYYALDGGQPPDAPSALSATTVSHNAIDLTWTDNSSDEGNFEVERSLDGTNFSFLALVPANSASYSDTGLDPETIYYYRVRAVNTSGDSDYSNVANTTTDPAPPGGTAVEVQSITVSTVNIGKGLKFGRAEVVVQDDAGALVSDAIVSGEFHGTFEETVGESDPTDANGLTVIDTNGTAKGGVSVTFCVTGIKHPTLDDFSAPDGTVCGSL